MKALLQRVIRASVSVNGDIVGKIGTGLVVLLGVAREDTEKDVVYLADKVANLRIFADNTSKFNLSAMDMGGEILVVSQFTLLADARKGRRPSFEAAASPEKAEALINLFTKLVRETGLQVETGRFQQHMVVEIHNDGPVTVALDSWDKIH
jgi:D-tyrosyl-tRNA(Tyr) deacylase